MVGGWCEGPGHRIESRGWISCHLLAIVARLQGEGSASQQCATQGGFIEGARNLDESKGLILKDFLHWVINRII